MKRKQKRLEAQMMKFQCGNLWFLVELFGVLYLWVSVACGSGFLQLPFITSLEAYQERAKLQVFAVKRLCWRANAALCSPFFVIMCISKNLAIV
mgnify:CR=1 FL=1